MRKATIAAIALTLLATLFGAPATPAAAAYVVDDGPRFSRPLAAAGRTDVTTDGYSNSPTELTDHVVELIRNTTDPSAIIRVSLYGWDDGTALTSELIKATERGVSVRILLDAAAKLSEGTNGEFTRLRQAIAKQPASEGSFIKRCGVGYQVPSTVETGRACLGTNVNHNKYFLFSKVGSSPYVVVQATAHFTPTWGNTSWDAMMTVVDKKALYDGYVDYFVAQTANVRKPDYYKTVTDGNYKAYFFPRAGNVPYTTSEDTIYGVLDNVTCTGNKTTGTSTAHRTIIRILNWKFTRVEVAKKLVQLAGKNCWIDIATNLNEMSSGVRAVLEGVDRINVDNGNIPGFYIHGKYLLIEGNYDGAIDTKNIWVGSANLTYPAVRQNDEAILKIKSASGAWHDAFRQNFRNIMAVSPDAW